MKKIMIAGALLVSSVSLSGESQLPFDASFKISLPEHGEHCTLKGYLDSNGNEYILTVPFVSDDGYYSTGVSSGLKVRQKPQVLNLVEGKILAYTNKYRIRQSLLGPIGIWAPLSTHYDNVALKVSEEGRITGFAISSRDDFSVTEEYAVVCGISAEELEQPAISRIKRAINQDLMDLSEKTIAVKELEISRRNR